MERNILPCAEGDDALLAEKINAFTTSMITGAKPAEEELIVFKVTDEDGNIIAGANLLIDGWKVAELDILCVAESYRKQGIGSALLREAERAAEKKNCSLMTLGTFDFQARPLYEKHGFTVIATLADCPSEGHEHYDMVKRLSAASGEDVPLISCAYEIQSGSEEDADYIDDRLVEYNWSKVPRVRDFAWIGRKIVGDDGRLSAGCFVGVNFWNLAFIDMLWVEEDLRGQGFGLALLAQCEAELKENGVRLVIAEARDWNKGFFEKAGYTLYGTIEDAPRGHGRYLLEKRL